jgi:hypothetical protein
MSPEARLRTPHHHDHLVIAFLRWHDGDGRVSRSIRKAVCKLTHTVSMLTRLHLDAHADVRPGCEQTACLHYLCVEIPICDANA